MTHPERDQDLLLLAHHSLPPLRAALTRWHLNHCPDCRRRLNQLEAVSHEFAGIIRGSKNPHWSFPHAGASAGLAALWLLAMTVLVVILLGTFVAWKHAHTSLNPRVPTGSAPCRPDLPSDRCH